MPKYPLLMRLGDRLDRRQHVSPLMQPPQVHFVEAVAKHDLDVVLVALLGVATRVGLLGDAGVDDAVITASTAVALVRGHQHPCDRGDGQGVEFRHARQDVAS